MKRPAIAGCLSFLFLGLVAVAASQRPPETGKRGDASPQRRGPDVRRPDGTFDLAMMWSRGQAVGKGPVRFTHSPMRLEDIEILVPYGLTVGAHVTPIDHQYYYPKPVPRGGEHFDVRAPADGFIVTIGHRVRFEGSSEAQRDYDDYQLVIEHSSTFYTNYDLLTKLDKAILDKLGSSVRDKFAKRVGGSPHQVRIPVKAGQVIGKVGGRSLDFGVVNSEVRLKGFLTPAMYGHYAWRIHTVDPFDYFDEPLKSQLLALNPRKAEPRGGKIDYDIDGRLVGNWFKEGTGGYDGNRDPRGYWMGHLALVYHHIDPSKIIVSIGDFDGRPRQFMVKGNGPDPAEVTRDSGLVKYELIQPNINSSGREMSVTNPQMFGTVLVELLEGRRLRVEVFVGRLAKEVQGFSDTAAIYER